MSDGIWVDAREFRKVYGRSRQWWNRNCQRGGLIDFGISTLQIVEGYGKRTRWFFLVPHSILDSVSTTTIAPKPPIS